MYLKSCLSSKNLSSLEKDKDFLKEFLTEDLRRKTLKEFMKSYNSTKDSILKSLDFDNYCTTSGDVIFRDVR